MREPSLGAVEVKVVDFGAAMVVGASRITKTGVVYGTPHYMSPEQAAGQQLDHRADIYALGVLLFEMLIGNVPFEGDTYMEVLRKHMMDAPVKPSSVLPSITPELDKVILHALAKNVDDRFLTMESFAAAIDKAAITLTPDIKQTALAATQRFDSGPGPTTAALLTQLPVRSRARTAILGGAIAFAAVAIAFAFAHAAVTNADVSSKPSESASISTASISPPSSTNPNQKSIDAVVAAPLSTTTAAPSSIAASALTPPHSSSRPRDQASPTTIAPPKSRAAGDFPDPWSK